MHAFYKEIGGKSGNFANSAEGGDDLDAENKIDSVTKLYRGTESGQPEVKFPGIFRERSDNLT